MIWVHQRKEPPMTNLHDAIAAELQSIAEAIDNLDGLPEELLAALRKLTELHEARKALADFVAARGDVLVTQALQAGIPAADLFGLPYEASKVRKLADAAGIPKAKPGPKRVRPQLDMWWDRMPADARQRLLDAADQPGPPADVAADLEAAGVNVQLWGFGGRDSMRPVWPRGMKTFLAERRAEQR
jgi:hypothetical protein